MSYLQKELYTLIHTDSVVFDFIQDTATDGLWYWDVEDPEQVWINEKFWINLGYRPEDMPHLASSWKGVIIDDPELMLQNLRNHCANPTIPFDQIVRYRHMSGRIKWIRTRGKSIKGEDGHITRFMASHVDLTELKTKEDFLYQCNLTARIGYWEVDLERGLVEWSQITKQIHEVPADYVPDIETAINFVKEGPSRELVQQVANAAMTQGIPYDVDIELVTATGREIWARPIGKTHFENRRCVRFYGTFQDITERKLADLELERTVLLLNDAQRIAKMGAWSLDVKTNWITWSEEVYHIHEVDLKFDCNLEKGISFYHPDYKDVVEDAVQRAITDQEPFDLM